MEPIDIHTHRPDAPLSAIRSVTPDTFIPVGEHLYSAGYHPWTLPPLTADAVEKLGQAARHPQTVAIGESGLDRLHPYPDLQMQWLDRHIRLAEATEKPLILHNVRYTAELIALHRKYRPAQAWILHGFRGKPDAARQLLDHGFYLSFGERYNEDALRAVPDERLFIETDESPVAVEELYRRAATVRGTTAETLADTIYRNVRSRFHIDRKGN